ncbi:MAG: flavodoxin family protein [Actinomycetia bacterium]|nr:flavodoxin family protein [Actinomycetes bacterium]
MSVLLLNGSAHEKRCTFTALQEVARGLGDGGIDTSIVWIGKEALKPCIGCGGCRKTRRCAFGADDGINALIDQLVAADGLVIGSPVYFAGVNGALKSCLDRMFFAGGSLYAAKPAACVVSARRAGTTAALEQIQKYPLYAQMPLVSSFYWPMVHGSQAEEVKQDLEGMQTAYYLGANMAWLIKSIQAGSAAGLTHPQLTDRAWTNFIR